MCMTPSTRLSSVHQYWRSSAWGTESKQKQPRGSKHNMSKTLFGQLLRVTLLTGQLCTVTFVSAPFFSVTLVISQIRAESVSYEEYACKSRSLKRNDKQFEMSALNPIDDPYTRYKRERNHRDDEGSRVRGRNRGNRDRDRKNRRWVENFVSTLTISKTGGRFVQHVDLTKSA